MRDLYICSGKYHLFNAVLLKMLDNKDKIGDLMICDCFEDAKQLYERMISFSDKFGNEKLFEKIIFLNHQVYEELNLCELKRISEKIKYYISSKVLSPHNRLDDLLIYPYSGIYIAGIVPPMIEYCLFAKRQYNSEIMLFDDGMGSRLQWKKPSLRVRVTDYCRITKFWKSLKCKYFFSPQMVCDVYPNVPIVEQCKPLEQNVRMKGVNWPDTVEKLNYIFDYNDKSDLLMNDYIVYFSAGFDLYQRLSRYSQTESILVNEIGSRFVGFVAKKHPNSTEPYNSDIICLDKDLMPEMLFLNTDIENKILISSGSATIFNPVFIYKKNPYVILTYKLFDSDGGLAEELFGYSGEELDKRIYKTLISGYTDQSKVSIPKTMDELNEVLNEYLCRIKNISTSQ